MPLFIGFTGPKQSGKTLLIRRLMAEPLEHERHAPVGMRVTTCRFNALEYRLADCNFQYGLQRDLPQSYLRQAGMIVYVVDLAAPPSTSQTELEQLKAKLSEAKWIIVANKLDLDPNQTNRRIWEAFAQREQIDFFALSVQDNQGIEAFKNSLFEQAEGRPIPFHQRAEEAQWQAIKAQLPEAVHHLVDQLNQQLEGLKRFHKKQILITALHDYAFRRINEPDQAVQQLLQDFDRELIDNKSKQKQRILILLASLIIATLVFSTILFTGLGLGLLMPVLGPFTLLAAFATAIPAAALAFYHSHQQLRLFARPKWMGLVEQLHVNNPRVC